MKITAMAGGVGGARLADGLYRLLGKDLTVVVNTGDDFTHYGLHICPDVDTVCYTLAGLANPETGWGRAGETWSAFDALERLGGPAWFRLGDLDLATHLERTRRQLDGQPLSQITADFCHAWDIQAAVLPMSDDPVATTVMTATAGDLPFQDYFVRLRCEPAVRGFRFEGIQSARPGPGVIEALENSDFVVLCPSNPWVSIGPILSLPGVRAALQQKRVTAVSPIIGGQALKGPAAKMYAELGIQPSALAVADHYRDFLDGIVIDSEDEALAAQIETLGIHAYVTDAIMHGLDDRSRLAAEVLNFCGQLPRQ